MALHECLGHFFSFHLPCTLHPVAVLYSVLTYLLTGNTGNTGNLQETLAYKTASRSRQRGPSGSKMSMGEPNTDKTDYSRQRGKKSLCSSQKTVGHSSTHGILHIARFLSLSTTRQRVVNHLCFPNGLVSPVESKFILNVL
ncbi:hypothetical protein BP00DRAFT_269308 [Aspergillus indologenus CBS 114.80]|uniref:Uncharacterized protein n=1 Tax=Aspergillus indologenus CBS 114.80 TaxID=1450541 RepID=A0A2V5HUX4_9EURO|nr:hypothetical protein BP00DRAFT_269308 [Aspergillus indologenus CBS 114.80]